MAHSDATNQPKSSFWMIFPRATIMEKTVPKAATFPRPAFELGHSSVYASCMSWYWTAWAERGLKWKYGLEKRSFVTGLFYFNVLCNAFMLVLMLNMSLVKTSLSGSTKKYEHVQNGFTPQPTSSPEQVCSKLQKESEYRPVSGHSRE